MAQLPPLDLASLGKAVVVYHMIPSTTLARVAVCVQGPGFLQEISILCVAKILSGSEINSLHTFLSRSICYDCCSCSATWDYGRACSRAAGNRVEACSWKISLSGNSWPC